MESRLKAALDVAWIKIQIYCKKYAGHSIRDVQVRWIQDGYCWREFGVTSQGVAYINSGDHSDCSRGRNSMWLGHPEHKDPLDSTKYGLIEQVVRDWPKIKEKLEKRFEEEKLIFAFEP